MQNVEGSAQIIRKICLNSMPFKSITSSLLNKHSPLIYQKGSDSSLIKRTLRCRLCLLRKPNGRQSCHMYVFQVLMTRNEITDYFKNIDYKEQKLNCMNNIIQILNSIILRKCKLIFVK